MEGYIENTLDFVTDLNKIRKIQLTYPTDTLEFIGIASDGITSFVNNEGTERLPFEDVIKGLTTVKVPYGRFLERTCNHYLASLKNAHHYDDLSIGVALL